MTVEDYNLVITEKDKIIETISNDLDLTKEKLNILEFKYKNLFSKYQFNGYSDLCKFLYNYYIFLEKYGFKNFEDLEIFVDFHKNKKDNVNIHTIQTEETEEEIPTNKSETISDNINSNENICNECGFEIDETGCVCPVNCCKETCKYYDDEWNEECKYCIKNNNEKYNELNDDIINDNYTKKEYIYKCAFCDKILKDDEFCDCKSDNKDIDKNYVLNSEESVTKNIDIKEEIKKEPDEDIENNNGEYLNEKSSKLNKESNILLNRIKNNYINFSDEFLPVINNTDINENYRNINKNIITKKRINIENIIQYSNIYEKFINSNNKVNSKSFSKFIEYNEDNYNKNYYKINKFYEKTKKCYNFINFFKNKNVIEDNIIDIIYKSNLSYTKLYKIKKNDYEDLKVFFLNIFINK